MTSSTLRKNHKRDTVRDHWAIMKDMHESHYRLNRLGEEESIHFVTTDPIWARKRHSVGIGCHAWRWLWWLCQALLARSRYTNLAPFSNLSSTEIFQCQNTAASASCLCGHSPWIFLPAASQVAQRQHSHEVLKQRCPGGSEACDSGQSLYSTKAVEALELHKSIRWKTRFFVTTQTLYCTWPRHRGKNCKMSWLWSSNWNKRWGKCLVHRAPETLKLFPCNIGKIGSCAI